MKLFLVQDSDGSMYVLAENWQAALDKWKIHVRAENDGAEPEEPEGISLVAREHEVML